MSKKPKPKKRQWELEPPGMSALAIKAWELNKIMTGGRGYPLYSSEIQELLYSESKRDE